MHRYQHNVRPCQNKLVEFQVNKRNDGIYKAKLQSETTVLDTHNIPRQVPHQRIKAIKCEQECINKRNDHILLQRMTLLKNEYGETYKNTHHSSGLTYEKKRQELLNICKDNATVMKTITDIKPYVCRAKQEADFDFHKTLLNKMSRYPEDWWKSMH
nr:unnamed protein product [Spirometra erinaceieuropaei]